jgi:bacteriocin-like protein
MSEKLTNELTTEDLENVTGGQSVKICSAEFDDALELGTDATDGDATVLGTTTERVCSTSTARTSTARTSTARQII